MNWQSRLEKTVIALNLISLALGFGTLGLLILVKGEHAGESWISGVLGMVVGSLFLLFAFYFCKHNRGGGSERSAFTSYSRISSNLQESVGQDPSDHGVRYSPMGSAGYMGYETTSPGDDRPPVQQKSFTFGLL